MADSIYAGSGHSRKVPAPPFHNFKGEKMYKREESNFRVVVEPEASHSLFEQTEKSVCQDMVKDIKRHIDNVSRLYIDCDIEYVCEFCGTREEKKPPAGYDCCENNMDETHMSF